MAQQQPPMVKLTSKNHRTLPILDYYLTFIHYFGFGINPDDDHRSRYLSIRVKRSQTGAASSRALDPIKSDYGREQRQWLASYTRRAQLTIHSLPFPLFSYLKMTAKCMAIIFNTFIATNHCIVLVDYVCSGSRGIEDIILDIRLVITKLSALIFVLSWHHKRHEVRQLIKLVKSTSLYILATHGQQHQQQGRTSGPSGGQGSLAPESPIPSPIVVANTTAAMTPPGGSKMNSVSQTNRQPQQDGKANESTDNELVSDEIGSSLRLDTSDFDKRILKGWFGCLLIIIVHFSLSEAEISKSHHLWQWLDDYSLHQLGNQSVSYDTLMFLATFDNYIYTVHVYGTRLIGASIICIVCSLQHEVIKSLNLYSLRLIRRSQQPLLRGQAAPSSEDHKSTSGRSSASSRGSPDSKKSPGSASTELDSGMFFVLGESDWFRVRDFRNQLEPHGHLTSCIWRLWQLPGNLFHALVRLDGKLARDACRSLWANLVPSRPRAGDLCRVTPKNGTGRDHITLGQVASSLIVSSNGGRLEPSCCRSINDQGRATPMRPTPLSLSASAMMVPHEARYVDNIPPEFGFLHANKGKLNFFNTKPLSVLRASPRSSSFGLAADRYNGLAGGSSIEGALWRWNPLKSSQEYQARLMAIAGGRPNPVQNGSPTASFRQQPINQLGSQLGPRKIELQLERLSTKYELVRTVNARIDACFGPMLLIQFSFLFLMSCIDVVFFSLCFSPNTKTKYIILLGMVLLWCPYMLIYKFASDMGSSSGELLVSIRRLARLYVLEDRASVASIGASSPPDAARDADNSQAHLWSHFRLESTNRFLYDNQLLASSFSSSRPKYLPPATLEGQTAFSALNRSAGIIDKLDHIFKPTHLSIMGIMTVDKFFLLNFAKIVITSSVMMIQFISN